VLGGAHEVVEERVGDLLLQLLHELLERLARLPVDEVVVLELLDTGAGVVGDRVEAVALVLEELAQRILPAGPALAGPAGLPALGVLPLLAVTLARLATLCGVAGVGVLPLLESLVEG